MSLILEQFIFVSTASAQTLPITPDGTTNTQVTQTASGIDQVNIAAPNANGTSINKYTDYNVNTSGQIINNFSGAGAVAGNGNTAVVSTQIGGLVTVNQNLVNSGSAKVILNEVTSNNVSKLLGYTEIAGGKADLILANSNGIVCSGCGFINTSRLTFIAGSSEFDSSGNLKFNLKGQNNANPLVPLITIDGLGLDVEQTSSVDVIASSVKLISSIYGGNSTTLNIKSGEGKYDYSSNEITDPNNSVSASAPLFAIDASSLAKIQAGQIYIIANKKGLGVNMAAEILAQNEIVIDANGDAYYSKVTSGDKATFKATGKIESVDSNSAISAPNLTIQASEFKNLGLASAYNLIIKDSDKLTNLGDIEALNLTLSNIGNISNSGMLYGENSLNIGGTALTNNSAGTIFSRENYAITLTGLLTNSGVISSDKNLTLSANSVTNNLNSEISAQGDLSFSIAGSALNSGSMIAGGGLTLTANSLSNSGLVQSADDTTFNLATLTNQSGSLIYGARNLTLNLSSSLTNSGEISALGNLEITGASTITNSNKILSNGNLTVTSSSLTNNSSAAISSLSNSLFLTLSGNLQNNGELSATKNITSTSANLTNSGNILATENLTLTATNLLTNSGNLQSKKDLSLTAATLDNYGLIKSFQKLTFDTDAITNRANAVIFATTDSTITANNSLTNYGSILAQAKLDLTLGQTTNSGDIFSAGNLKLTLSDSLTNSGSISSIGQLDIISTSSITNNKEILSSGVLNISGTSLTNSDTIQSTGNLTLDLTSLTNSKKIASSGTFDLTASGNISNTATLQSSDNFTINAASFTNSANSLILSGKDLTITAGSIVNSNTKPSNSIITSGLVSVSGAVALTTNSLNNNSGIIVGRSTTVNALSSPSVTLLNTLGSFISTASVTLTLGDIDYTITGTVTADNVDITANNIVNQGNVTATDFIKLTATGSDGVSGSGNITNGFASGDNSNVLLAAGSYIDFTAKNNINNYGTISATTDLSLTATEGNVNNYSSGKITGGTGTATVNALNGTFYNFNNTNGSGQVIATSLFTSDNDAIFNVKNLSNSGEISVANDLTTNVTGDLNNNSTAYIWSGHDAIFNVANNFINTKAEIYAERNLTIQKSTSTDTTLNKTASFQNLSGNIETYSGDLTIKATSFYNGRKDGIVTLEPVWDETYHVCNSSLTSCQYGEYRLPAGSFLVNHDLFTWIYLGSNVNNGTNYAYAAKRIENNDDRTIYSGKDLIIQSNSFNNDVANLLSKENTTISFSSSFQNNAKILPGIFFSDSYGGSCGGQYGSCDKYWVNYLEGSDFYTTYNAFIKSGTSLTITQNGTSRADLLNSNTITNYSNNGSINQQSNSTTYNQIDSYTLGETGVINVDLTKIASAIAGSSGTISIGSKSISSATSSSTPDTVFSGSYKINLSGSASDPLVEARGQFTDITKFFGSSYYFTALGLNGTTVLADIDRQTRTTTSTRILGDAFVETKLILDQLKSLTNDSLFLSKTTTDYNAQIKELLDNSVSELARLGLNAEDIAMNGLTTAQTNSLTKDIVTFETTKVNGINVLAPKIYLSADTRSRLLGTDGSLAKGATIAAGTNLTINASYSDLTNNGSLIAGNNLTLNLASLTSKTNGAAQAEIKSGNNLAITAATGDIKNIGANIKSIGSLNLTASNGSILNSAIVATNDANLLASSSDSYQLRFGTTAASSGNIKSTLFQNASISGGSVDINAANNFTNLAASVTTSQNTLADSSTTSGNLAVTAGNNIDIGTLQLHNRTESSWGSKKKGGTSVTDTVTNISSNISSAGDLSLTSTGLSDTATTASITIIGSNVSATGNGSLTSDFGNVNIANAVDSVMTQTTASKKGSFHSRLDAVYDYKEAAVESNLNFGGDLTVSAELGNMNLIGSTLKTSGDLNIGSFTVAQNTDGSYKTNADGTFQTVDGGSVLGVNIKAAELRSEHSETHTKSKLSLGDTLKTLANPIEMAKLELGIAKFMLTPSFNKATLELDNGPKYEKSSSKSATSTTTQHSATLDVGGNLMVNSTGDLNIAASDVNVAGNALMNVDGNVNIASAAETNKSSNQTQSIEIGTMKLTRDTSHASGSAGVEGTGTKFEDSLTTSTQKSSNINIGGSLLANVTNDSAATNSGNLTLAASNMTVGGDSIIKTSGDFSLTDAQNTSSYSSKESTLTVEAGAKVGNAYVDAAYAWKAVADAEKKAIQAVEKLKKMEDLKDDGKASDKAVELAAAQVVLAQAAVASATLAAAAATAGAASAASTSFGTGMYGAGYLNITSSGIKNTTNTSLSQGSSFVGYGDIDIASNNNVNVVGSILSSVNGNTSLSAAKDIKIEAGTNTLAQTSKQETIYGGGSVGNNGVQVNIGLSQGESDYNKTFYTNSQVSAENGTLTLNTGNDANISGANLLAKNVALNIGNNLNVSSKQTEEDFSSSGFGFNFGAGVGAGGNGGNVGGGFNMSSGDMHRLWVDDITTIKGTDSMAVNVGKDLNLTGAAILSDNLALAVSGNTNKKELNDSYYSESMGIGLSTNFTTNGSQPTIPGTGGQPNQFPGGSTSISGSYAENESNRTVYATIGGLDSTLTSATKDMTGGDFEASITLDHRLFSEAGRNQIGKELNYSKNLATTPFTAAYASYNSKEDNKLENFANATAGATVANTRLLLNQNITAQQLAGDTTLLAYEGSSLSNTADAKGAYSFYDSKVDTAALNSSVTSKLNDSEVAGLIGHEAIGHKIGGGSEFVANFVGQATQDNWSIYQGGNTSFNSSLPTPTALSNTYASNVQFGQDVHPFLPLVVPAALTAYFAYKGEGNALKGMSDTNSALMNSDAGKAVGKVADTAITGADVIANKLGAGEGTTPVRDALNTAGKAYDKYVPEDSKEALSAFGLTTTVLGAGSIGRSLLRGTELEIGGAATNSLAESASEYRIGYHATTPEKATSIENNGFMNGTNPGRLGSGGVYVNNTPQGAISEFMNAWPDREYKVLSVSYKPGVEAVSSAVPQGQAPLLPIDIGKTTAYRANFPLSGIDSITAPSTRAIGTTNTNILNNSAQVIK